MLLRTHDSKHLPGLDAEADWVNENPVLQFLQCRDAAAVTAARGPKNTNKKVSDCTHESVLQSETKLKSAAECCL
jgi:hypothetical protein